MPKIEAATLCERQEDASLVLKLEPLYAAEAKRRQASAGGDHGNQHTGGKVALSQKSDEPPARTDEHQRV